MNRSITAVPGVEAGHFTHPSGSTGTTAILFPGGAVAGGFVPGSAPGSREHGLLEPRHLAPEIHGVCLSGGSAFGLSAADGVMAALDARGVGLMVGTHRVPLVPAAILFDLPVAAARPDASWGRKAAEMASTASLSRGRVGAGAGARVGLASGQTSPGGIGGAVEAVGAHTVGVVVALNAFGSVVDPATGAWVRGGPPVLEGDGAPLGHTTLVVVATDLPLDKAACGVVARMASAGLARTLVPAFAPIDGDTVIVASTGGAARPTAGSLTQVGHAAAVAVAAAVLDAVESK
mgnify:CR=1 FL=1